MTLTDKAIGQPAADGRRPHRSLIHVLDVIDDRVMLSIPGWRSRWFVERTLDVFAPELRATVAPDTYYFGNVNVGAESSKDLAIEVTELAPEPEPEDVDEFPGTQRAYEAAQVELSRSRAERGISPNAGRASNVLLTLTPHLKARIEALGYIPGETPAGVLPWLVALAEEARGEVASMQRFIAMLDNPQPIADKSDPDVTHFRSALIHYVVTCFARQLIAMTPEQAPNCISVIASPSSADHDLAGYRMLIAVARPGKLLPSEQRDEAWKELAEAREVIARQQERQFEDFKEVEALREAIKATPHPVESRPRKPLIIDEASAESLKSLARGEQGRGGLFPDWAVEPNGDPYEGEWPPLKLTQAGEAWLAERTARLNREADARLNALDLRMCTLFTRPTRVEAGIDKLIHERDEARKTLDEVRAALGNGADDALWPPGKTLGEAVELLATMPFEVRALAKLYNGDGDSWTCLRCGCEWPCDVVTACANCHQSESAESVLIRAGADTEGPRPEGCDCANPPPFPGAEGAWGVSCDCPVHGD